MKKQINSPITHFFPLITTVSMQYRVVNVENIKNPVNSGSYKRWERRLSRRKWRFSPPEKQTKSQAFRQATETKPAIDRKLGISERFYIRYRYKKGRPRRLKQGAHSESVDKPGSVVNGHSSATSVTRRL
jgi:hypothetical protein